MIEFFSARAREEIRYFALPLAISFPRVVRREWTNDTVLGTDCILGETRRVYVIIKYMSLFFNYSELLIILEGICDWQE